MGSTKKSKQYEKQIMDLLPKLDKDKEVFCTAKESELGKYFSNVSLIFKLICANLFYDVCERDNIDYEAIKRIASLDSRIGESHLTINEDGRWACGHCFPKDLLAFIEYYWQSELLNELAEYNYNLAKKTNKDIENMKKVYWY